MGTIELVVMVGMIAFNSVFAAYEIALAAVSIARLQVMIAEKRRGAAAALYMKENMEGSLAAVQIGITLFGAIAAATGGAGAGDVIEPWLMTRYGWSAEFAELVAVAIVVIPLTGVTIMFGELVPKVFALRNKEWVCLKLSPALKLFTFSVWPAVWFFESIVTAITNWGQKRFSPADGKNEATELQELRALAAMARTSRLIGQREEGIIVEAARLAHRPIRDIMLPASAISMLDVNESLTNNLIAAHLDMHTRFPVTVAKGDPQRIRGYVNVKDIVAVMHVSPQEPSLRSITRPLTSFREGDSISNCLEALLRDNAHIALVRNYGDAVVGMVTLEDIVEELLGDIKDEYDRLPDYVRYSAAGWIVGGGLSLGKLKEQTNLDLAVDPPPTDASNLNEWLAGHLGRGIKAGDSLSRAGIRVLVRKVRRQRLLEAQISKMD